MTFFIFRFLFSHFIKGKIGFLFNLELSRHNTCYVPLPPYNHLPFPNHFHACTAAPTPWEMNMINK